MLKEFWMDVNQTDMFISWLDSEEKKKNWSDYELAKSAGISHSVLSRARQGILPKWDACEKIATAFGVPKVIVYQKAGLLEADEESDPWVEEMAHKLSQLPPGLRDVANRFIDSMVESEEAEANRKKINTKPKHKSSTS